MRFQLQVDEIFWMICVLLWNALGKSSIMGVPVHVRTLLYSRSEDEKFVVIKTYFEHLLTSCVQIREEETSNVRNATDDPGMEDGKSHSSIKYSAPL